MVCDIFGLPVKFEGALGRRAWLRRAVPAPNPIPPALTVSLAENERALAVIARRLRGGNALRGEGFVLDYAAHRLYYPRSAPRVVRFARVERGHDLLARTVCFALALMVEKLGRRSEALRLPAPLYLHASAVAGPRGALVFCGQSTFGKSTLAEKLLAAYPQLEDDQVIALVPGEEARTQEAPRLISFVVPPRGGAGEARAFPAALPIAGIFWLDKARHFALAPMNRAEAAALLLPPVANHRDPAALQNRLRLVRTLLARVPCQRLSFRKESAPLEAFLRERGYL